MAAYFHRERAMPLLLLLLVSLFFTLCSLPSYGTGQTSRDGPIEGRSLNQDVDWLVDPDGRLTIDEILLPANQSRFVPSHGRSGVGPTAAAYWLRLRIEQPIEQTGGDATGSLRLLVDPPNQDDLRLYYQDKGTGKDSGFQEHRSGALVAFAEGHDLDFGTPSFRLPEFSKGSLLVYLRVQTFMATPFQLSLWHEEPLRRHLRQEASFLNILYGVVIGLIFYNLFLAFSLRDITYFAYVLNVCVNPLFIAHLNGDDFKYLWPDRPDVQIRAGLVLGCLWSICAGLFVRSFLSLGAVAPRLARISTCSMLALAVAIPLSFLGFRLLATYLFYCLAVPWATFLYATLIYRVWQGFVPARYALVGFSVLEVGVIFLTLVDLGVLQVGFVSEHGVQIGTTFETLIFSLALAARIRLLLRERDTALHDPLTGLLTRRLFDDRFQQACRHAQRQDAHLALLLIDLDRFKPINDRLGHDAGDAVLKAVAQRLKHAVRATDSVSRFGGDEFAIILNGPFLRDLPVICGQQIIKAVQEPILHSDRILQISLSIGIAYWPESGIDFTALYKAADQALYQAKHEGRATVRIAAA